MDKLQVVFVQAEVRLVFMVVGPEGRPTAPLQSPDAWVLCHRDLDGLRARVEAYEREATARGNGGADGDPKQREGADRNGAGPGGEDSERREAQDGSKGSNALAGNTLSAEQTYRDIRA